jgi:hypothetical protein
MKKHWLRFDLTSRSQITLGGFLPTAAIVAIIGLVDLLLLEMLGSVDI